MSNQPQARANPECPCPHKEGSFGLLYGVSMGRGMLRMSTDPDCPIHNEHAYIDSGKVGEHGEPVPYCRCGCRGQCAQCGAPRVAWIHPETR